MYMEKHPYMCSQKTRDLHVQFSLDCMNLLELFPHNSVAVISLNNNCDTLFCLFIVLVLRGK